MEDVYFDDEYYDDQTSGGAGSLGQVQSTMEPDFLARDFVSLSLGSQVSSSLSASITSVSAASLGSGITTHTTASGPQVAVSSSALGGPAQTITTGLGLVTAPTLHEGGSVSEQVSEAKLRVGALKRKREELELLAQLHKENGSSTDQTAPATVRSAA